MIAGIYHQGSGIGNQMFRYITTRTLAEEKGYEWGMITQQDDSGKEIGCKFESFIKGDVWGKKMTEGFWTAANRWEEKKVVENGVDVRGYDPEINFVQDVTFIDGEFQDIRYWGHNLRSINEWLKVPTDNSYMPENACSIGFRGGEYAIYPDLYLPKEYWDEAKNMMRGKQFYVHTDDPVNAKIMTGYEGTHDPKVNWWAMRYSKYAIIANSSFYIIPRLLKHFEDPEAVTIAPRYWARHNIKVWALPQNYYPQFTYI